ncbi:NAD(P)-binding protein [Stipitochalara longipes BDJ]|nr:NAD(P)-binding protein [Stipitochalara longipes BDJ]
MTGGSNCFLSKGIVRFTWQMLGLHEHNLRTSEILFCAAVGWVVVLAGKAISMHSNSTTTIEFQPIPLFDLGQWISLKMIFETLVGNGDTVHIILRKYSSNPTHQRFNFLSSFINFFTFAKNSQNPTVTSYLITGASRGIGFEFLQQLSADVANKVTGLVRDKDETEKKIRAKLGERKNATVDEVAKITGGSLDIIIANAGYMSPEPALDNVGALGEQPERFEEDLLYAFKANVIGNIHLFNLFMPLILKARTKKVLTISTGLADDDWTTKYDIYWNTPYAISKAGLNMAVAKFSAQYRKDGVLFITICPGVVDTGYFDNCSDILPLSSSDIVANDPAVTEVQTKKAGEMLGIFKTYSPQFAGPVKPEAAVKDVLSVLDKASVTSGSAGAFFSHFGNKKWL